MDLVKEWHISILHIGISGLLLLFMSCNSYQSQKAIFCDVEFPDTCMNFCLGNLKSNEICKCFIIDRADNSYQISIREDGHAEVTKGRILHGAEMLLHSGAVPDTIFDHMTRRFSIAYSAHTQSALRSLVVASQNDYFNADFTSYKDATTVVLFLPQKTQRFIRCQVKGSSTGKLFSALTKTCHIN